MEQNAPWWFVYVSTWLDHMMPRELTTMISDHVCDHVAMREEINITHEWWIECGHSLKCWASFHPPRAWWIQKGKESVNLNSFYLNSKLVYHGPPPLALFFLGPHIHVVVYTTCSSTFQSLKYTTKFPGPLVCKWWGILGPIIPWTNTLNF